MWKLLFFIFINGQPTLGIIDVKDKEDCHDVAEQIIAMAVKDNLRVALKCEFIKIT